MTAVAATLLGPGSVAAAGLGTLDSSLLIYSETDRVKIAEAVLDYSRQLGVNRTLGVRLTLDALTGASPNGATPSSRIQTFTSPSGNGSYVVNPGELPLDSTFEDMRGALDASLRQSLDRLTFVNVGGHLSIETDYTSLGVNGRIERDLNRRNTTIGLAASYTHDIVSPLGGVPVPLAPMPPPGEDEGEADRAPADDDDGEGGGGSSEGKDIVDMVVGLTQILDRNTIVRFDYSLSRSSGYLNDPYKIVSLVQNESSTAPGEPSAYLYEARPETRNKQALFAEARRYIAGSVLNVSYRYFWDDWGIRSHTADVLVRFPVRGTHAVEPHFRWYRQSGADFYRTYLVDGRTLPEFASADFRLAAFDAMTWGLKYSFPVGGGARMSLAGEYYTQMGERAPPDAFGVLREYDLFPGLDVFMIRVGFSHGL